MIGIVVVIGLVLILFFNLNYTENFIDLHMKTKLKYNIKDIPYSNFLVDLDTNLKKELDTIRSKDDTLFKQKVLCDNNLNIEVQNRSLDKSFNKISGSHNKLLVFDGSNINNKDNDTYIKQLQFSSTSDEHKLSNSVYFNKIDNSLNVQNNTKVIQNVKFQDNPGFNYTIEKDNLDPCLYKANKLSEYTNPRLYLSSNNIFFPPRFIEGSPYKNIPLSKTTNLKLWTDMYNCCSNGI